MQAQRIIVVGGSSGIGRGIVIAAHKQSAEVLLVGRSRDKLEALVASLPDDAPVQAIVADVTNEADVVRLFAETGPFDHLVSTVADLSYQPIREFDLAAARRSVDSKLMSSLLLAKHGCAHARRGGSFTFTSGIAAYRPMPRGAIVAAINGALTSLAYALALELAPLRVNVVSRVGWTHRSGIASRASISMLCRRKWPIACRSGASANPMTSRRPFFRSWPMVI